MKITKATFSPSQIKALLRKDFLVRWRQPWMPALQVIWPCLIFMLLYLIRLKFGPEHIEDCQFPTRQLPSKNQVLPGFYSYICSLENKCLSPKEYEEYSKWENAPMSHLIDLIQIVINNDGMFNAIIELPEKASFINTVTSVVTSGHLDELRVHVEKIIDLIPTMEQMLNGSFDITKLFSDRHTFVKAGHLMCGHPFPNTEVIPLVEDILHSEDFSKINDDEMKAMPTKYCKKLYLDVTSSNYGKITWNVIKPIIHGKILYAPNNEETRSIMQFSNTTFEEINRLKMLSVAIEQVLTKLRTEEKFKEAFDSLIRLAQSPFVRSLVGDEIDIDQIEAAIQRIRTDPIIYDVVQTIKNILECFSVDRIVPLDTENEMRQEAYDLNQQRMFYAAVYFNSTNDTNVVYKFHSDKDNTQPTFENRNRFWFPGPAGSMLQDLKYHRGFIQIKHAVDIGIIKHKKKLLRDLGILTEPPPTTTPSSFKVQVLTDSDDDEDDDDWFTDDEDETAAANKSRKNDGLISTSGISLEDLESKFSKASSNEEQDETDNEPTTTINPDQSQRSADEAKIGEAIGATTTEPEHSGSGRAKRQSIFDLFSSSGSEDKSKKFEVDNLRYFTKQFPYPAYTHDDFKVGLYLAQAVQVAFFLGLVAQIASCVRHRIWMRESRNTMIMRSMGLKPSSECTAWIIVTFIELFVIFLGVTLILYSGGILKYTSWIFVMMFLVIFGVSLIAFCFMCSTFFTSATIGAVATAIFFFITYCPYIIVLLFDSKLNSLQYFGINLSFTTAFSHAWSNIMRLELQEIGMSFEELFSQGVHGEFGFGVLMIVLDTIIYVIIGMMNQRYKDDEFRFIKVQREDLDANLGATLTNVSKIYDEGKVAVSNVSLSFPRNQVTCLLGRNGAGKSTIIKMLTGQVVQSTGRVILSQAMTSNDEYDKVGVCSQDNILIPNLTAREHLELYAKIKLKHSYGSEVEKTLRSLNFGKHESYQACQLSGGYQRRLCVAVAFIGSPNVVILDEPCNGVDFKARKDIWELIERLRKGRAVVFATHFLDEAEYLSDAIIIMKNGKIIARHNQQTLKDYCTTNYEASLQTCDVQTTEEVGHMAKKLLSHFQILEASSPTEMRLEIAYDQSPNNVSEFLLYLQELQQAGRVRDLSVDSQNLEKIFKDLDSQPMSHAMSNGNGHCAVDMMKAVQLKKKERSSTLVRPEALTRCEAIRELFWKRFVHFSRNYRILLCVIVMPAIFELLAMWFVAYRVEDDFDKTINLTRDALYPRTTQMLSMERPTPFTREVYDSLKEECSSLDMPCKEFSNSRDGFYWILHSLHDYHEKRYGGYTFNETKSIVWYNNKGYHAMMAWLNDLNTHLMQTELNDSDYSITTLNEPWSLGYIEFSVTSIRRQAADSCLALILLIAFSLVVAVASVYLVNERVKGEKLQQRLCGVDTATYWGVAFVWDILVLIVAIVVCIGIILAFGMPVFVDRQQLWGFIILALFFGFACIPAIHVFEKCFTDASVAIVAIFCMNIIIPLFTMAIITLLGVVGDSEAWDDWRFFLNRVFLIFPQHALGDGLLELCKNYMVAQSFLRYDIDSYKNPVNSDLLRPHLIALAVLGSVFAIVNALIESGRIHAWKEELLDRLFCVGSKDRKHFEELRIVSIQNSLKRNDNCCGPQKALKVENLCKSYGRGQYAVRNVTFGVLPGECFGLLGKNGAGKSTIFKMLSGQMPPNMGSIDYFTPQISYCPQTNTLDSLLTVEECIKFYGRLRRITDIPKLTERILESYQLESYRDVLVKNLSGGNRRKLTVATTCCGHTSVVLMDEPTSDMDPVTRGFIYRTIHDLLEEERAIVLTSHSISEIDNICHRIAVLKDGQILTCSSPENLKAQYGGFYNVAVFCDQAKMPEVQKALRERFPQSSDVQIYAHSVKFSVKVAAQGTKDMSDAKRRESGVDVPSAEGLEPDKIEITLSDLFRELHVLSESFADPLRYTVSHCRLDVVFERILDNSERRPALPPKQLPLKSTAVSGSASTGYIHNGYVETETL